METRLTHTPRALKECRSLIHAMNDGSRIPHRSFRITRSVTVAIHRGIFRHKWLMYFEVGPSVVIRHVGEFRTALAAFRKAKRLVGEL